MTNQEVVNYLCGDNVLDHFNQDGQSYIADEYVKAGYGQVCGGYFEEAYKRNMQIWKKLAEPSQKWHLLVSYYEVKKTNPNFSMNDAACFGRILCPQLMMWIAEMAGVSREDIIKAKDEAIKYEEKNNTKDSRKIKSDVLSEMLHWTKLSQIIEETKDWDEVKKEIAKN